MTPEQLALRQREAEAIQQRWQESQLRKSTKLEGEILRSDNPSSPAEQRSMVKGLLAQGTELKRSLSAHIANKMKMVPAKEKTRRLEICQQCPSYNDGRCKECGCFLGIKTGWEAMRCPLKKW